MLTQNLKCNIRSSLDGSLNKAFSPFEYFMLNYVYLQQAGKPVKKDFFQDPVPKKLWLSIMFDVGPPLSIRAWTSVSGEPGDGEWAALMIRIREDKLTSDLTVTP